MVIYAQQDLSKMVFPAIFLAGHTPRDEGVESWRPAMIAELQAQGFKGTILVPEMEGEWSRDFEYGKQIDWEERALNECNVILFWIPRSLPYMPAFTTNIEFGMWLEKDPKKITLGWPKDAYKMNYIEYKAKEAFISIQHTMKELAEKTLYKVKYRGN